MKWINVKNKLPHLFEIVWIYWKDREVLLGCRTAEDCEPNECWYSFEDEKCRWNHWWMSHKDSPCDKPRPPNYIQPPSDTISFKRYSKLNHYGEIVEINELDNS